MGVPPAAVQGQVGALLRGPGVPPVDGEPVQAEAYERGVGEAGVVRVTGQGSGEGAHLYKHLVP